jgi:YD repeat-containing protein
MEIDATGSNQILTTKGLIDDVRIYPKKSTMSTFAYDPKTWKVTAMTDINNITTYYEYDDAGRLIKVIDEDNNLLKAHSYKYSKNNGGTK